MAGKTKTGVMEHTRWRWINKRMADKIRKNGNEREKNKTTKYNEFNT
jgi:hypothetical protein